MCALCWTWFSILWSKQILNKICFAECQGSFEQTKFALLRLREASNKLNFVRWASGFNVHLRHRSAECQASMYILDICLLCEIKGNIFDFNEKSACTVAERSRSTDSETSSEWQVSVMLNLFQHPRSLSGVEGSWSTETSLLISTSLNDQIRLRSMTKFDFAQWPISTSLNDQFRLRSMTVLFGKKTAIATHW